MTPNKPTLCPTCFGIKGIWRSDMGKHHCTCPADPDIYDAWDNALAEVEGWRLWCLDDDVSVEVEALRGGPFASNSHAVAWVRAKSDVGSEYHTTALRLAGLLPAPDAVLPKNCQGEECPYCSGEGCMTHGNKPCECDVVDRHEAAELVATPPAEVESLQSELDSLRQWKSEMLQVLNSLNLQAIGKELNLTLGSNIPSSILPNIISQKQLIADQHRALAAVWDCWTNGGSLTLATELVRCQLNQLKSKTSTH